MVKRYINLHHFYPHNDFISAADSVLNVIATRIPFMLWMITETRDDDWIVLAAQDGGYNVNVGDVFKWSDSFCYRMAQGLGPYIAPESNLIPAYACAPIGKQVEINAYIGIPLIKEDGSLFGTLCGIDPKPQSKALYDEFDFVVAQARMLSTILSAKLNEKITADKLNYQKHLSQIDELTKIYNRRGWDKFIEIEQQRSNRYHTFLSIIIIDLDNLKNTNDKFGHDAGDKLIIKTANCLQKSLRPFDVLARLGGDEFAILLIETNEDYTLKMINRIRSTLVENGIQASIGWECNTENKTLEELIISADKKMYKDKQLRKKRFKQ